MPFARGERPLAQNILRRDLARHLDGRRPASLRRRPWPAGERAIHFGRIVTHAFDSGALLGERAGEELHFPAARWMDFAGIGHAREMTRTPARPGGKGWVRTCSTRWKP